MPPVFLQGKKDTYIFTPDDSSSILKEKGKLCSVYQGMCVSDKNKVVVKKLNPPLKNNSQVLARFRQEALFNFIHPNIVRTIDFIEQENDYYLIREYVVGKDLQSLSKEKEYRKKISFEFLITCCIGILDALEHLHQQRIYHCDIRPTNILVEFEQGTRETNVESPSVKLIDFGLTKISTQAVDVEKRRIPFALIYSPPEQLLNYGHLLNATSDIYSLGISVYELITGSPPFKHEHPEILMHLQLTQEIKVNKKLPDFLYAILLKATNKYKFLQPPGNYSKEKVEAMLIEGQQGRYQSANELKKALLH